MHGRDVRLDYCFVSASLGDAITVARIDARAAGSDHQPLWVEIDLD
jgi:exonuclease III